MKKQIKLKLPIVIVLVVVLVILVNVLVNAVVQRYALRIDMTSSRLYQVSDETIELLKGVDKQVDIYCISESRDTIVEFSEMLDKYDNASDLITVTYINPNTDVVYINQLEEEGIEVGLYSIIVECEGKRRVLEMADMYVFSNDGSELVYFNAESVLTSAIVNVASQRDTGVGVVLGHGEEISTSFQELCVLNNFELGGIVLNKDVSEDIDILLVMAPQTDFSEAELVVLDKFFARGGAMAVFSDPSVSDLPNLDSFLLEWGIEFEDNVVFDSASNIESNPINVIPYYIEGHEITEYFMTKQYYTVTPAVRSIVDNLDTYVGDRTLAVVLATSDNAYARDIHTEDKTTQKMADDEIGPFIVAMTSTMSTADGSGTAKIFALGSKRVYSDEMMQMASIGNEKFLAKVLDWMDSNAGITVAIPPKEVGSESMAVTSIVAYTIGGILVILFPLLILLMGVRVYFKRRNL